MGTMSIPAMVAELRALNPLLVDVQVRRDLHAFQGSGIYRPASGAVEYHAMCVVGYGTTPGNEPYWIAKNSFGTTHNADGFVRLAWADPFVEPERTVHALRQVTE
jgi:C1A family cysteine protease